MNTLLIFLSLLFIGLTLYVYVGYPLLIGLWAKLRAHPPKKHPHTPPVSLIIAAYNEASVITTKIENSLNLDYPHLEIIVVTDGSSDNTPELARQYEGITVLHSEERRGKSAAINRAVDHATGEILVFSDANAYYNPNAIRHLVDNFHDETVGCVSGRKTVLQQGSTVGDSEGLYWKYESFIKVSESAAHSSTGVVGEMIALRKSLYRPIPQHIINDDAFLAVSIWQQGYRVLYEPQAISWETPSASVRDDVIRRQRINAGRYQLMFAPQLWLSAPLLVVFMLLSHKFSRLLLPFFMLGALCFNLLLLAFPPIPWWLQLSLVGQLLVYGIAILGGIAEKIGIKNKGLRLAYYLVSSNGAALQGFFRFMRGKQTVLWEKANRT